MVTDTKSPALQFSAAPDKSACLGPAKGCSLFAQVRQELDSLRWGRKTLTQIPGRSEKWGQQPPTPVGFQHWADWRCPPRSLHTRAGAHTEQLLILRRTPQLRLLIASKGPGGTCVWRGGGDGPRVPQGTPWELSSSLAKFSLHKGTSPLAKEQSSHSAGLLRPGWSPAVWTWAFQLTTVDFQVPRLMVGGQCPLTGLLGGQEERRGTWSPPEPSTWWEYKHLLRWVSSSEASLGNDTGACAAADPQGEGRGLALRTSTGHPTSTFSVNRHGRLLLTPRAQYLKGTEQNNLHLKSVYGYAILPADC